MQCKLCSQRRCILLAIIIMGYPCIFVFFFLVALPYLRFKENENTVLITTTYGGHFGFLEGLLPFG